MRAPRGMSARHGSERGRPPGGEICRENSAHRTHNRAADTFSPRSYRRVYGESFSGRCLRIDFSFLLCFYRTADAQCGRREYVGRVRVRQVPQGPDPARAAALPRRGVRSAGRQFPSRALRRLQGQPQRDARRHRRVGSVYRPGARGDAHSGARDSRLRSRRRDRHAVAESGRRRLRGVHGNARQGLRATDPARGPDLQTAQGRGRRHRDHRLRADTRALRHRRSVSRDRRACAVGRRVGQYSGCAGHRPRARSSSSASSAPSRTCWPIRSFSRASSGSTSRPPETRSCWPSGWLRSGSTCPSSSSPRS